MRRSPPTARSRGGFTLLELVIAAALTTLVLTGISGMIFLIYRVQEQSADQVHLAQTGRNLLRKLEWDLQAIAGQLPEETSTASSGSMADTGSILALDDEQTNLEFDDSSSSSSEALPTFYLLGEATTLEFVAQPALRSGQQYALDEDPETAHNLALQQQRLIVWGNHTTETLELTLEEFLPDDRLVRAEALTDSLMMNTEWVDALKVPELAEMQFLYFDGTEWLETWESDSVGSMPVAIEATVTLQAGDEDGSPTATFSRTILLPSQRFRSTTNTESDSLSSP